MTEREHRWRATLMFLVGAGINPTRKFSYSQRVETPMPNYGARRCGHQTIRYGRTRIGFRPALGSKSARTHTVGEGGVGSALLPASCGERSGVGPPQLPQALRVVASSAASFRLHHREPHPAPPSRKNGEGNSAPYRRFSEGSRPTGE
jgi:hypothetical protein